MRPVFISFLFFYFLSSSAFGFVPQIDRNKGGRVVNIRWPESRARSGIPYWVDTRSFPFPEHDVLRIAQDSFGAWQAVESAYIVFDYRGTGRYRASSTDRKNVVLYDATGLEVGAPPGSGVIAITRVNWNDRGEVTDADIVFNGRDFGFSAAQQRTDPARVDLQGVMTHEIGHFLGLDHTPLEGAPPVRPTMNPYHVMYAPGESRSLEPDDIAGVTALYPSNAALNMGAISGRVAHRDGSGTLGVHVVAYQAGTETFMVSAISGAAGNNKGPGGDGAYEILALPPGDYQVEIEPIDGAITYENFGGIFHHPFDTDFPSEFYDNVTLQSLAQVIRVGPGRAVGRIDFTLGLTVPGFPFIQDLALPVNTPDVTGPYRVEVRITDDGSIASAEISYRINGGAFSTAPLQRGSGDDFFADIPGQPRGTTIEYRLEARDGDGNETYFPALDLAPFRFEVLRFSGEPVLYVALRRSNALSVIDTGVDAEVARIPMGDTPLSVVLTPDSRYLFVANTGQADEPDNRVTVVETATHRVVANIRVGLAPLDLAISPDGRRVYVTNSRGQSVSVLDVERLEEVRRLPAVTARDGPYGIAVSPGGQRIYVTDIEGHQVMVLDAESGTLLKRIDVVDSPRSLALSPGGDSLYVVGFDGGISVVDARVGQTVRTIDTAPARGGFRIALSPDGETAYVTDPADASLLVVDLVQGRVVSRVPALPRGENTRDLAVSSDGGLIYLTNQDSNDLIFFDTASLRIVRSVDLGDGPRGIAVRRDPPGQTSHFEDVARADFDGDGGIDFADFLLFAGVFGTSSADPLFDPRFDLDRDGRVNFADFLRFAGVFGQALHR